MDEMNLGNLDSKRDWGYALEYVETMWLILQQKTPDDYVVATGEAHTVKELAELAFQLVGLDWEQYCKVDKRFLRPLEVNYLCGDYSKANRELGWAPRVKFRQLIEMMVKEDLQRWERWLKGERFPWDAPNYPNENKILSRMLKMDG
jgi:GDPmannose 4,6-dehydratase